MPRWPTRSLVRYALLQLPAVILLVVILYAVKGWIGLPPWSIWGIVILWIAKDVILFPMVWRAYDSNHTGSAYAMIGQRGTAQERLDPSGYIRVRGELWRAEAMPGEAPIEKGQSVSVREVHGLTLVVQAENDRPTPR